MHKKRNKFNDSKKKLEEADNEAEQEIKREFSDQKKREDVQKNF